MARIIDAPRGLMLANLISSYPILIALASQLSTLDIFHLALTSKTYFSYILASRNVFTKLSSQCLCDGHGLRDRQAFAGLYAIPAWLYRLPEPRVHQDEEIEVCLFNRRCDPGDTLPCCKCGINVCEECRYYPRVPPPGEYPIRRPHLNSARDLENIMCLCTECDEKAEEEVKGKFLNGLCDCDVFTRWICGKCCIVETRWTAHYFDTRTKDWNNDGEPPTKTMHDHQFETALWCLCGAAVPEESTPRCTWCRRRHLPEAEWGRENDEIGCRMPYFENNPCYPFWVGREWEKYPDPYPKLGYSDLY